VRPDPLRQLAGASGERAAQGLLRRPRTIERSDGRQVVLDGRTLLAFCSNDYLGLAHDPRLLAPLHAARQAGAGAAHLVTGHHREHAALEAALAEWTQRERALLFSTGVMANAGVLQALAAHATAALSVQDRLNHASLLDGAALAGAELCRYPHGDAAGAARQLASRPGRAAIVSTDGVFSMDGDVAPLGALATVCQREGAILHVDDAHGLGVLGPQGAGSVLAAGLGQDQVPVLMGTLGKALGGFGAFVAGSARLVEGLTQFARGYVYTTAMPPALAAAMQVAVGIARSADDRRDHLASLVRRFRDGAAGLGLATLPSATPIQPVLVGGAAAALQVAARLEADGILVVPIRPPTVPAGKARLRITLSAAHTAADVDRLLVALARALAA
jgi:8-amino-7-oxononanoate synthase